MNARHHRPFLLEIVVALTLVGCKTALPPAPPQFEPAENLLTIIAEFQRYRDADLYRFPYPRDVSGQNVFKSTLVRMSNYETLYPKKYGELIAFTRAQAYARLGDYETAARFCKEARAFRGDLAARTAEQEKIIEDFRQTTTVSRQADSLADFQKVLEERVERCRQLAARYPKPPWQSLAQCEWEQAEVDLAEFIWANRQVIRDGPKRALDLLEAMRTHHRQSKNFYRHTLRLGDLAGEMATEYATLFPPERGVFAWEEFERWAAKAKSYYLEVAQSFGAQERTEASAKLAALEALEHRIRELNQ
jgi:hypothetical protein